MNRLVKKLMVVLLSAFMVMGVVTTPVQAKGSSSDANGWGNWWGWWWPVQPKEPEPVEEPVIEEEPVDEEVPEQPTEPVVEETPVVEEEPVYTTDPIYAESANYSVTVSFDETAQIPAGTVAAVTEFAEGSPEYEAAKAAVLAADDDTVVGFAAFDVSLYYNNEEFEPASDVNVSIDLKASNPEADTYEINHLDETSGAVEVETVVSAEAEATSADFAVAGFSTFTITWRSGDRTVTVHYVDESGTELPVSDSVIGNLTASSSSPAYLIYDVDGYEYSYTYRNNSSNRIGAQLAKDRNNRWYYYNESYSNYNELSNGDNIYVVYKKKATPTTGGTVQPSQEEWPEGNDAPKFTKSSVNNGDGTNTISLGIKAAETISESSSKANVIVVFDVSGSMSNSLNGRTRLQRAKDAVNDLADQLLAKKDSSNNPLVKMALVSFSTTAAVTQALTSNATEYKAAVNNLSANGGTNWEQSLQFANQMAVDSDAATFIVFVTDGNPTFRMGRGNVTDRDIDVTDSYYRNYNIYGTGSDDEYGYCFDFAVDQVSEIIANNKTFFAIGVSSDVTKVQTLATEGGAPAENAFLATDAAGLEAAFDQIANSISSTLGFGNVQMNDGITALTNSEMKVMEEVDPNSFRYYRYGGEDNKYGTADAMTEWTTRAADGCAAASYNKDAGAVQWNMGEGFQLEDGVTYVVTFNVWPSQAAYDLVADLNNGIRKFSELTEEESKQVVQVSTNPDKYALKTNTDEVSATYNKTTKTGEVVTVSDKTNIKADYIEGDIENMSLDAEQIALEKLWPENMLDGYGQATYRDENGNEVTADHIDLTVTKDGEDYLVVTVGAANSWKKDDVFVSCGLMTVKDGVVDIKEAGHDYTVIEPAGFSYYWDLLADVYHPMVINGEATLLVLDEDATTADNTNSFKIGGKIYKKQATANNTLEASNYRRSNLNLTKVVDAVAGLPGEFTFAVTVNDANSTDGYVWFSAYDTNAGATVKDTGWVTGATAEEGNTGYWYAPNGTTLTLKIKAGWNVRFLNLYHGSTFSFEETEMPEHYEFVSLAANASNEFMEEKNADWYDVDAANEDLITGTITEPNNSYTVTYTNKYNVFYVYHSGVAGNGNLETVDMPAEGETYDLTQHLTADTLYGGYYLDYAGKGSYADDGVAKTDGVKYTGMNYDWSGAQTVNGKAITPVAGETYYIKEVPTYYLRNYHQINFMKVSKELKALYLISAIDDLNYNETGFVLTNGDQQAKVVSKMTFKNYSTNKTVTLKAETVFKSLGIDKAGEYLTYFDATSSEYFNVGEFTVLPYWITPDGITVNGISTRTITIKSMTKPGITKVDE